jgi:hypothetical protein
VQGTILPGLRLLAAGSALSKASGQLILEGLGIVLSIAFLSAINIIISGHLLGFALKLPSDQKDNTNTKKGKNVDQKSGNQFGIGVPYNLGVTLYLAVRGPNALAGFTAFAISLGVVGLFLFQLADTVFIHNLGATDNRFVACEALAAVLSVVICVICGGARLLVDQYKLQRVHEELKPNEKTPEQRAEDLVRPE